jgi:protein-disulfide isomerase
MEQPRPDQLTIRVDPARDHRQGSLDAELLLVVYGDFECPFSAKAAVRVARLQRELGDRLCVVFRHLPLNHKHPHAQIAAEAAEAAGAQNRFWDMYRMLFVHQSALERADLERYAQHLGLDVPRLSRELDERRWEEAVRLQAEGARMLGATGTPSFFIDGRLYDGPYEPADLARALSAGR